MYTEAKGRERLQKKKKVLGGQQDQMVPRGYTGSLSDLHKSGSRGCICQI